MSKYHLPYPGRHESFNSWDYRCKQWESNRRRSQSRGLSGRPDKRCIEGGKDGTEETNAKIAGRWTPVRVPMFAEHEGRKIRVMKRGYGHQNAQRVRAYAERHGLQFRQYDGNGCTGMCNRTDGEAFRYVS
jgi:hypothetical protein